MDLKQCRAMGKEGQDLGGLLNRLSALVLPNPFDFSYCFMFESLVHNFRVFFSFLFYFPSLNYGQLSAD